MTNDVGLGEELTAWCGVGATYFFYLCGTIPFFESQGMVMP